MIIIYKRTRKRPFLNLLLPPFTFSKIQKRRRLYKNGMGLGHSTPFGTGIAAILLASAARSTDAKSLLVAARPPIKEKQDVLPFFIF
ncbi:hypothetical protein SAMN04488112_11610 [Melghirimyces thermohalophilus]|uniref:Uncharacterized protein n=1 Tax=Melghirimyces thermohalophilus TaxID=1236220 RepID=A0A1G6PBZ1_9BACL|nr:hypothetical protein SAMN04488112_11610 [Melghirimyces thermohalophilus]